MKKKSGILTSHTENQHFFTFAVSREKKFQNEKKKEKRRERERERERQKKRKLHEATRKTKRDRRRRRANGSFGIRVDNVVFSFFHSRLLI